MQVKIKGDVALMPLKKLQDKKTNRGFNNQFYEHPKGKS